MTLNSYILQVQHKPISTKDTEAVSLSDLPMESGLHSLFPEASHRCMAPESLNAVSLESLQERGKIVSVLKGKNMEDF